MKNYAKMQNNKTVWYVHDKKGDINIQKENLNQHLYIVCTQRKITQKIVS